MRTVVFALRRVARIFVVLVLVAAGSTALVRYAPGYLSDGREMDARYAGGARDELAAEAARSQSVASMLKREAAGWLREDLGVSRQYDVPVLELIKQRLAVTAKLLTGSIALAWVIAGCAAVVSNWGRRSGTLFHVAATVLLAVPIGAMATICLLADRGGPLLVMTTLLATRDYKFLDRMVRKAWLAQHLLHARASGISPLWLMRVHLLPSIGEQLGSLATLSILTALGAMVPVEVIFSLPGIGQLAWNAAMNRDLPVLLAITMMMAVVVTASGAWGGIQRSPEWKNA